MKSSGYKVELVTEFAKDLVYQESFFRLKDQLMILARQNHKLWVLKDKVDYAIVDSPLLLSQHYFQDNGDYSENLFKDFVLDTYNRYNNLNIFLQRNIEEHPYQEYGRSQTLDEAIEIDKSIKDILDSVNADYKTILVSSNTVKDILKLNLPNGEKISTIEVYNTLGQKVSDFGNVEEINLKQLKAGVYIINMKNNKGKTYSSKIVKQ